MARTQVHRQMSIGSPLGDDVLLLRGMSGSEQLGRPFAYHLDLLSEKLDIDFDGIVGENVTVRMERYDGKTRYFNGFVSRFAAAGRTDRLGVYQATVVPWLWFLTRTSDCRIFQSMKAPDIIKQVFRDHGFTDFDDALSGSYRTWDYCVQYRETDFNFVSRLMEQEGIYYFFKHENGKHTLVLSDGLNSHKAYDGYASIRYHPVEQGRVHGEYITDWTLQREVQSGAYVLNDFDFAKPKKQLEARAKQARQHAAADFEIYDYPGEYLEYADGEQYARARIDELQAQFELGQGATDARGLSVGFTFNLQDHPNKPVNKEYLITAAQYHLRSDEFETQGGGGGGEASFNCHFSAVDSKQTYRPPRITPKPVVQGPQTAIVVGKSGEEIWTDEHGRVKVQFHWDRYSAADEKSSCWIRVSQPWAGKNWGAVFLPRIGQEVIVEFLEGDPDRPIVTGRVYNGDNKPPYALPANATMSTFKSMSSKGGGGFNELRFEDKKGEEQIFIHAEKNQDVRVKNDHFEWIGNNRHLVVKKDQFEHVELNRHEEIDQDLRQKIGKDVHLEITGKEAIKIGGSLSLSVTGDVIEEFKANHSEQVTQNLYLKAMGIVIEATQGITLKVGGSSVVIDNTGVTVTGSLVVIDGKMTKINSGPGSPASAGTPGALVTPTAADPAEDADDADPGKIEEVKARQRQQKKGKYGAAPVKPYKPPETEEEKEKKKSWIEIELVDQDNKPVPGERYRITLPDDSVAEGTLDDKGFARIDGIEPGNCKVCFPNLDQEIWEPA